ncbi:putative fasciclin-like arabinogalactan protein [Rosa chinensis]|uniref:Putative fasciclin-like arabinogalactan protein n=1 Tax=Rosa chinensis TaxID=74649 RepID=A0A2P6QFW2_ROSCH|nr:putative fasciclin-like arabinogalactan protein [Rosa chinensis]
MQLRPATTAGALVLSVVVFLFSVAHAHNITRMLAKHPEFSTFNHYLSLTHLAADINDRTTITVCAVDNSAMSALLAKHLSIYSIKNILSLHVLLDYFGAKKLHQITNGTALAATMFQATGSAPGSAGFVNITDLKGGKVGFTPRTTTAPSPRISNVLPSAAAEAPTPGPAEVNLTGIMSAHGCKVFAETLLANPDASKTFNEAVDGGLTVFCPGDDAFKGFLPKYKNLSAPGKAALLEYHAAPVYQSMPMLKSNNGLMNTLATNGAEKYDFTVQNDGQAVTLKNKLVTAKIIGTLIDEQPLAIYTINKVLTPKELYKGATPTPAPAPAPEKAADAPKSSKEAPSPDDADSPADSPEDDPADQTADDSGAFALGRVGFGGLILSVCLGFSLL